MLAHICGLINRERNVAFDDETVEVLLEQCLNRFREAKPDDVPRSLQS